MTEFRRQGPLPEDSCTALFQYCRFRALFSRFSLSPALSACFRQAARGPATRLVPSFHHKPMIICAPTTPRHSMPALQCAKKTPRWPWSPAPAALRAARGRVTPSPCTTRRSPPVANVRTPCCNRNSRGKPTSGKCGNGATRNGAMCITAKAATALLKPFMPGLPRLPSAAVMPPNPRHTATPSSGRGKRPWRRRPNPSRNRPFRKHLFRPRPPRERQARPLPNRPRLLFRFRRPLRSLRLSSPLRRNRKPLPLRFPPHPEAPRKPSRSSARRNRRVPWSRRPTFRRNSLQARSRRQRPRRVVFRISLTPPSTRSPHRPKNRRANQNPARPNP